MFTDKKILLKLYLLFIPIAYFSSLFHELGHWIVGEILGNKMVFSLNYVWPKGGHFLHSGDFLLGSIGGPVFTILLAAISLIVIERYLIIYFYPVVFFQFVMRFFALGFGGFTRQDEAKISYSLGFGTYTIGIIVLLLLLVMLLRASYKLKINLKINGYFFATSILCDLMVIATYKIIGI